MPTDSRMTARILVVDDEAPNVELLERFLRRWGYRSVRGTTDAGEVMALLSEFGPDLVLLDLHMPRFDGFEVMRQIKEATDDYLPILVLTADVTPEAMARALSEGAKDFLTKPFNAVEAQLRVANLVETRFLYRELREQSSLLERKVRERTAELQASLEEMRRIDQERRMLLERVVSAAEEERRRIAGDIHDDPVQIMAAVSMRLQTLSPQLDDPAHAASLERLDQTVTKALGRLRNLMFELRPPALDREGLAVALRQYLDHVEGEPAVEYELDNDLRSEPLPEARMTLFRITQEALTNVRKHARAKRVRIQLSETEKGFLIRIQDDGVGFLIEGDPESPRGHLGLSAMRERAGMAGGWWRVDSQPGVGTTVEFWVPDGRATGAERVA
ncbi:MAG: ATP-binding response regulator [Actinomycetota bacterium]